MVRITVFILSLKNVSNKSKNVYGYFYKESKVVGPMLNVQLKMNVRAYGETQINCM